MVDVWKPNSAIETLTVHGTTKAFDFLLDLINKPDFRVRVKKLKIRNDKFYKNFKFDGVNAINVIARLAKAFGLDTLCFSSMDVNTKNFFVDNPRLIYGLAKNIELHFGYYFREISLYEKFINLVYADFPIRSCVKLSLELNAESLSLVFQIIKVFL